MLEREKEKGGEEMERERERVTSSLADPLVRKASVPI